MHEQNSRYQQYLQSPEWAKKRLEAHARFDGRSAERRLPEMLSLQIIEGIDDRAYSIFVAKLEALLANRPEFAATWEHTRLLGSPLRTYDMSLCAYAKAAMTDDELALLIVNHRVQWDHRDDPPEPMHYIQQTIHFVRKQDREMDALAALARRAA